MMDARVGPEPSRISHAFLTFVLGTLTAFGPLSIDMYLPSLPSIQSDLHTTPALVQLTLASFMIGMGVGQLLYGPLSDRRGRRAPLLWGVSLYTLSSLACALSPNVEVLIACRFLQAIGGAAGPVIARAVVRDRYTGREIARVLSLMMLVMGAAPILAPLLGGLVLQLFGWRAIFGVLVAIGVLSFTLALIAIPRTSPVASGVPLAQHVRALFADRRFVAGALAGGLGQATLFTYISSAPFVFMTIYHVSPRAFGGLFGLNAAAFICASQLNRLLLARFEMQRLALTAACALSIAACTLLAFVWSGSLGLQPLAAMLFCCMASLGFILPNTAALALEQHAVRAGVASSVIGAFQFGAGALGASIAGALSDGTARPMGSVMASCACLTLAFCWLLGGQVSDARSEV
jgi:DHA1 family bicyclomycin/chloramphenicol resistance-like MFS transporter